MANVTGILASIGNVLSSVTGIGQVYTYRRYAPQDKDFKTIAVTGSTVNFWDMYRASTEEHWPNDFQFKRLHTIVIRGYLGSKDASATDLTFQTLVDRAVNRFRTPTNRTLSGTVESLARGDVAGLQVQSMDLANVHGVLCHSFQGRLVVGELPSSLPATGVTQVATGPRIIFINSIGATADLTISSTNPSFPRTFIIDEARKTPWRSASLGSPSVTIDVDFGAATNIQSLAVLNHNFSAGTYRLYYGATSPATNVVTLTSKSTGIWLSFFATKSARYWRLSLREAAIASAFYQIGELWLANYITLSKWHDDGSSETHESGVKQVETDGGVRWRLSGFQRESRSYQFEDVTDDGDWSLWKRVFANRGREHPFFYVVNPAVPTSAIYCTLSRMISNRNTNTDKLTLDIGLDEDL